MKALEAMNAHESSGSTMSGRTARLAILLAMAWGIAILLAPKRAEAYAWMIRHDYAGCGQCHADPAGGSLLTPYGRSLAEVWLRSPYGKKVEEPGKIADFMFGLVPLPESLLLGGDVRPFYLSVKPKGAPAQNRFMWMQADVQGQLTVGRVRGNASVGYAPEGALPAAITHGQRDNVVSRAHWVGVDLGEDRDWLVRAGRMNLPFGIRFVEHTYGVRQTTRTDINDQQQHGAALAYSGAAVRGEIMVVVGNLQLHPDAARSRGGVGYIEFKPADRFAFGFSSLILHSKQDLDLGGPAWRQAHAAFGRYAPIKMLVLMVEGDLLFQSQPNGVNRSGYATVGQADLEVTQGVHLIAAGEAYNPTPSDTASTYAAWGGVNWFFAPHADARVDLAQFWTGSASQTAVALGLHLFL
jgi:hypothetical protein